MPVNKQVVLITGASTGFGRLIAETLARAEATSFSPRCAIPRAKTPRMPGNFWRSPKGNHSPSIPWQMDVTSEASVENAVRSVIAQAGRIDVAINNAGYAILGLAEATTTQQAQQIFDTNFFGCQRVNRAVLPHMRRQRSGLLMHVSSGAGRMIVPAFAFYCATKFAMEALAEGYHYELAPQGIESVIVEPGAYKTPVFGNMVTASDAVRTETYGAANAIPPKVDALLSGTTADPQEVADAVLQIIETPVGQKKLRYRVSPADLGIDEINAVSATVQERMLKAFGIVEETTFTQQKAAAAD